MKKLIVAIISLIMVFAFSANAVTLLQVPQGGTGVGSVTTGSYLKGAGTGALVPRTVSEVKTDLSLNSVENTALSTWAGTTNITTMGTIGTGVWNGTSIADANVDDNITITNLSGVNTGDQDISSYMQDTDINTFAKLQSWAVGYTDNDTTYPYAINSVGVGGQVWKSDGVGIGGWGTDNNTTYTSSDFTHDDLTGFVANEHLDWTGDLGAVNIHAGNYTDTNTTYTAGTGLTLTTGAFGVNTSQNIATLSNLTTNGFITTSGGIGTLGIDTNTYLTGNQTITLSGDVTGSGTTALTVTVGADKILESHLKSVNAATDEYCLTYEATTGDFEWQACGGSLAINDITDITIDTPADNEVLAYNNGTSTWLNQTPAEAGLQGVLTNSAGLLAALNDETGTGLSVFSTSPTFTTPLLGTPTSGVLTNCTGTASGLTAGNVTTNANLTGDITSVGNATTITADVITHADIADSDQADTKCFYLEDPTADDDLKSIWRNSTANDFLLTEIWAESDQTVTFMLQVDDGTPADVDTVDLAPAAGEAEDISLDGDTTVAQSEELDLAITSVSGTPTWVSICFTGNWVD